MDSSNFNIVLIVLALISSIASLFFVLFLRQRQQQKQKSASFDASPQRTPKRFVGERVYSLALRGSYKLALRLMTVVMGLMPFVVLMVLWGAVSRAPEGGSLFSGRLWIFGLAMFAWSAITVMFLRSMLRYRAGTKVILSCEGVRLVAAKVGLFPAKDVLIRWERIESVAPVNTQSSLVIAVNSPDGSFHFNAHHAVAVSPYPVDGEYTPVENGNDLYQDLLEYSGLPSLQYTSRPSGILH